MSVILILSFIKKVNICTHSDLDMQVFSFERIFCSFFFLKKEGIIESDLRVNIALLDQMQDYSPVE